MKLKVGTINTQGMKIPAKREEIEQWMSDRDVTVLGLHETHIAQNTRESRSDYTWFFSGEPKMIENEKFEAGVGFVIKTT